MDQKQNVDLANYFMQAEPIIPVLQMTVLMGNLFLIILAEERYSIPFYPLLYLFAGFALWRLLSDLNRYVKNFLH
ncbi:hypothetical protein A2153_05635 [Candidatus Gottesmanbacteria bacterium RBG_16_38_7b]|uniref:Uncharacterized protein n=1 Tax=Candidatus Gottesmanbacteria bacterium RBG_16_38_7b TaxID=1798372 RepID=A0A1F5YFS5_9BACT|nr:MAG: hypothetical protein A2153_05635 [Candidatus Gottesmanbacteria bacterium RBG_16_38_7b]